MYVPEKKIQDETVTLMKLYIYIDRERERERDLDAKHRFLAVEAIWDRNPARLTILVPWVLRQHSVLVNLD